MRGFLPRFGRGRKVSPGIDVGTSSMKLVELAKGREGITLVNYGELKNEERLRLIREQPQGSEAVALERDIAEMVRELFEACGAKANGVSLSLPLASSFFSILELPAMKPEELRDAVPYEAKKLVPVPLTEVILDWEVVGKVHRQATAEGSSTGERTLVLLVAVPRELVDRSVRIAKLAGLELDSLEVETFGLVRSTVRDDMRPLALLDFAARSVSVMVVEEGTIRATQTINSSGSALTEMITKSVGVDFDRAEAMKIEHGIAGGARGEVRRSLINVLGGIADELRQFIETYQRDYGKAIEEVLLAGGSASLRGLDTFFNKRLQIPVSRVTPFAHFQYPDRIAPILEEIGPSFAVAVGLALRNVGGPTPF